MSNIEDFPIKQFGKEEPDRLLKAFNSDNMTKEVVIIGIDHDGDINVASSYDELLQIAGVLALAQHSLLAGEQW